MAGQSRPKGTCRAVSPLRSVDAEELCLRRLLSALLVYGLPLNLSCI